MKDASVAEPRGKFHIRFTSTGLSLEGKQNGCFVPWENITRMILVPNSNCAKKQSEDFLLLQFSAVMFNNKSIGNILFPLSKDNDVARKITIAYGGLVFDGCESTAVSSLISKLCHDVNNTSFETGTVNQNIFLSANGSSFLHCYRGTQEGVLYPMSVGLLFLRPIVFIPSKEVAGMSAGRGGAAQTKYVDLKVSNTCAPRTVSLNSVRA